VEGRRSSRSAGHIRVVIMSVLILGALLTSLALQDAHAASPPDVFQALHYYEGTWRVDVQPAAGKTMSISQFLVSISCSEVGSRLECRSHFSDPKGGPAANDFLSSYVRSKKDPRVFDEENLSGRSVHGGANTISTHQLSDGGQVTMREDSVEKGSFCGRGDSDEEEMHVYTREVSTIVGPDEYRMERFSKWEVRPTCADARAPEWVPEMTAVFHREK
jgi:hypothetical protein